MRRLRQEYWPSSILSFQAIHQAVEREAGRPIKASTVRQMLDRHGWGRVAIVTIPRQDTPPALSDEALAAQRSGIKGLWYMPLEDPWPEARRQALGKT